MTKTKIAAMLTAGLYLSLVFGVSPAKGEDLKEYRGILLSKQCYNRQPNWLAFVSEHELGCAMMPQCFLNEYFLVVDEDTVIRLDERGDLLARRVLLKTKRQNDFKVVVRGRLKDSTLIVQTLEEVED